MIQITQCNYLLTCFPLIHVILLLTNPLESQVKVQLSLIIFSQMIDFNHSAGILVSDISNHLLIVMVIDKCKTKVVNDLEYT